MHDASTLLDQMMGDPGICRDILQSGLLDLRSQATAVDTFRNGGSLEEAGRAFHSLRGSAAIFGARDFAELLRTMEEDCEAGRREAVHAALGTYNQELERYQNGLTALAREFEDRA